VPEKSPDMKKKVNMLIKWQMNKLMVKMVNMDIER